MKDQPPILAIKLNNCAANDPCAICGERTDPEVGPELFLEGTWALVCYECGNKYAPQLVDILCYTQQAKFKRAMKQQQAGQDPALGYDDPLYQPTITPENRDEGGYWNEDGFWEFSRQTERS
jgi:hypothetical protein